MALVGPRGLPPLLVRAVYPVAEDGVGAVVLVEGEVVVVVELAGGEEGQVVTGVGDQGVDDQARVPGDLA